MAAFLDTNVAVYAHDHGSGSKRRLAVQLLRSPPDRLVVSTQVLSEFYWTVTRKLEPPLPALQASEATRQLSALSVVAVDRGLVLAAIDIATDHRITLWDAMIIEAARRGGCDRVLTEDLNDGQTIHGILIENPFGPSG